MVLLGLVENYHIQIAKELRSLLLEINQLKTLETLLPLSPIEKYHQLPTELQQQVADFVDFGVVKGGGSNLDIYA